MVAILDMPESPAELAGWLDRVLMSENLAVVVDELTVMHQTADELISVEQARDWLGDSFPAVMERGLSALSHSRLRQLLVRPCLLPAIQELALISGGPYWNQLMCVIPVAGVAPIAGRESPRNRSNRWLFAFVPLAVAASVSAFVVIDADRDKGGIKPLPQSDLVITRGTDVPMDRSPPVDNSWGWNRTDLLDDVNSPEEIPNRLADGLSEWFSMAEVADRDLIADLADRDLIADLADHDLIASAADHDLQIFTLRVNEMWAGCEHFSTQPFNGMSANLKQSLRGSIASFQDNLEAVLNKLDGPIPDGEKSSVLEAAKKSVDSSVKDAVEKLRGLK
jgi:hypothetical protein